jgi:hypothetical protein
MLCEVRPFSPAHQRTILALSYHPSKASQLSTVRLVRDRLGPILAESGVARPRNKAETLNMG